MTLDFEKYKEEQLCDNTACASYGKMGGDAKMAEQIDHFVKG